MRRFLLAGLTMLTMLFACGTDNPPGTLMVKPDSFSIATGRMTFIPPTCRTARRPIRRRSMHVERGPGRDRDAEPYQGIQKVRASRAGQVVITASAFDQTAKIGMTVISP